MFSGQIHEGTKVLRKAVSSKADAGIQKIPADARIEPNTMCHLTNICPHLFAKVRHHIDERNLGGQENVCGVLDQFRRADVSKQNRTLQWLIQLLKQSSRPV